MITDPDPKNDPPSLLIAITVGVLIAFFWAGNLLLGLSMPPTDRGMFGDMFGAVNALFSGLALAGVIYAIHLQRAEIRLTKEDLTRTKQIFEKQSASLDLQNVETKKQMFEATFFQLLRVFTQITENLDIVGDKTTTGKDVFTVFEKRLRQAEAGLRQGGSSPNHATIYAAMYEQNQNDLGHYFRMLYTVLRFVDRAMIDDKKTYTNILRAQLSNAELHLILYNGLSNYGREKLKPLLESFGMFDNLPLGQVKYKEALREYRASAFGQNADIKKYLGLHN